MLFTILLSSFVIVSANPFHKYPFVFLLDIGNEELDVASTKQIRVSAPGGSIALRYPAIGDGETIAHLRVSGIDFGTDLKANIIDGGPGYKYVVLVFMGNKGVPYDAVVTIQTVPIQSDVEYSSDLNVIKGSSDTNSRNEYQNGDVNSNTQIENENNSAEDLIDGKNSNTNVEMNAELTQSSSDIYYVEKSSIDDNNDSKESDEEDEIKEDFKEESNSNLEQNIGELESSENLDEDDDETEIARKNDYEISEPRDEKYSYNENSEDEVNDEQVQFIDKNLYDKYQAPKPHFSNNFNVYPHEALIQNTGPIESPKSIDINDPSELEETFDDEEIHKNKDDSNYSDGDEDSINYKK